MKEVLTFSSYKLFLKSILQNEKKRGLLSLWSKAMHCQLSYLSRVIHSEPHLTPDQAFRLADYFRMPTDEKEYFLLLVDEERAGHIDLKKYLAKKRKAILDRVNKIENRVVNREIITSQNDLNYHSSWEMPAIHLATSIPRLQEVDAIAAKFNLSKERVQEILRALLDRGFVKKMGKKWIFESGIGHIPKSSPLLQFEHFHWRIQALQDAKRNQDSHFTSIFAMSRDDFERLQRDLLDFIENFTRIAGPSKCEEIIVFCADLFKI